MPSSVAPFSLATVILLHCRLRQVRRRQLVVKNFPEVRGTVAPLGSLNDVPKPVLHPPMVLRRLTAVVLLRRRRLLLPHKPPKPRLRLIVAHRLTPPRLPPPVVAHPVFRRQLILPPVRLKPVVHRRLVVVRLFNLDQLVLYPLFKPPLVRPAPPRPLCVRPLPQPDRKVAVLQAVAIVLLFVWLLVGTPLRHDMPQPKKVARRRTRVYHKKVVKK